MSSEANFRLFETKHVLRILVYLHLCGPKSKSDIYRAVSTNPRMAEKLDLMESRGLVERMPMESGKKKVIYDLTPSGENCASMFCRMEEESGVPLSELRSDFLRKSIPELRNNKGIRGGDSRLNHISCCPSHAWPFPRIFQGSREAPA